MNGWQWLARIGPGWPSERQWVTVATVASLWIMLAMAREDPKLWDIKLFEILIQGFALTGMLNMILAFHFSANKSDETKADNTGKMADAMKAVAEGAAPSSDPAPDVILKPGETAQAEPGPTSQTKGQIDGI